MASYWAYLAAPCSRFSTLESARVLWSLCLFCRLPSTQPNDQNHQYNHWWRCRMASVYRTSPHATVRWDLCCGNAFFSDAACDWIPCHQGQITWSIIFWCLAAQHTPCELRAAVTVDIPAFVDYALFQLPHFDFILKILTLFLSHVIKETSMFKPLFLKLQN